MVKVLREAAQNFFKFRKDAKRIEAEINSEGIFIYVQKHHNSDNSADRTLRPRHA